MRTITAPRIRSMEVMRDCAAGAAAAAGESGALMSANMPRDFMVGKSHRLDNEIRLVEVHAIVGSPWGVVLQGGFESDAPGHRSRRRVRLVRTCAASAGEVPAQSARPVIAEWRARGSSEMRS